MALQPWYKVATPRADLREGKPLDAAEFAVHLDHVRDGSAPPDYQDPARFFAGTFLTPTLLDLAGQVVRRLSGETTATSAVFNLATQFGGGKTHALTLVYHLAMAGRTASGWAGVPAILKGAGVRSVPKAAVAVFVGTQFDSLIGRGGDDGTPLRRTPWGEIAWQLGGQPALAKLAKHELEFSEPKGDAIRKFLPKGPCVILMDEILNYVSTYRSKGYGDRLYNFIEALSETARGRKNTVLAVSIPASDLEYTQADHTDERRFKKMLDRVGKAVLLSAETETAEIIRRRLFEWDLRAVSQDGRVLPDKAATQTCESFARWVIENRQQLPGWFPADQAQSAFAATYPFHPTLISVFERKWRALPRFQQTRGALRLLALWVADSFRQGYQGAHRDPLIGLGTAPLDDPVFRPAMLEQLDESRLEAVVTTDIAGSPGANAMRLDQESVDTIRRDRLHQKVATTVFFESNGGQAHEEATVPELRLGVAGPDVDIGNVETVLEALQNSCYFLTGEKNRYRFGLAPNLNKILADRRATIPEAQMDSRVRAEVQKAFPSASGVQLTFFPERSNDILDRPVLTLVILSHDQSMAAGQQTRRAIEVLLRECGNSARAFKNALLFSVADSPAPLQEAARTALAWESIRLEQDDLGLDDSQKRLLPEKLAGAARDLREAVWRSYRRLLLLGKQNDLREIDLGQVNSSAAPSMVDLILSRLRQDGDLEDHISPNFLARNWPPAFTEWPTKAVRDSFFASPQFPRLLNADILKETIASGVSNGVLGYVGKLARGRYEPFYFKTELSPAGVELSDDMFIITADEARKREEPPRLTSIAVFPAEARVEPGKRQAFLVKGADQHGRDMALQSAQWTATGGEIGGDGVFIAGGDEGNFLVTAAAGGHSASATVVIAQPGAVIPPPVPPATGQRVSWTGEVPPQKWMNLYTKVLTKFVGEPEMKLTVRLDVASPDGISQHKIDEAKIALRELGLPEDIESS